MGDKLEQENSNRNTYLYCYCLVFLLCQTSLSFYKRNCPSSRIRPLNPIDSLFQKTLDEEERIITSQISERIMNYKGVIIEESLEKKDVLKDIQILETKIEQATEKHKTPWIKQWTLHTVEIPENRAEDIAEKISSALDSEHNWYADFKNETHHFIIFRNKVFFIDRKSKDQYDEAKQYGISLGIPEYQVDFAPDDEIWER